MSRSISRINQISAHLCPSSRFTGFTRVTRGLASGVPSGNLRNRNRSRVERQFRKLDQEKLEKLRKKYKHQQAHIENQQAHIKEQHQYIRHLEEVIDSYR